jgi:hypothetical protein
MKGRRFLSRAFLHIGRLASPAFLMPTTKSAQFRQTSIEEHLDGIDAACRIASRKNGGFADFLGCAAAPDDRSTLSDLTRYLWLSLHGQCESQIDQTRILNLIML